MPTEIVGDIALTLDELKAQVAELMGRLALLEHAQSPNAGAVATAPAAAAPAAAPAATAPEPSITEEEVLAIAAAIGAYLGVRAHIRHIRLLSSNAWAQQGRVSIQASHRLV